MTLVLFARVTLPVITMTINQ